MRFCMKTVLFLRRTKMDVPVMKRKGNEEMAKQQQKTNAMRILEQKKLPHRCEFYECDEFHDAVQIAEKLGQSPKQTFKTLICHGKSGGYYAFVLPGTATLDLKKAAAAAGEKSVEMVAVKDIQKVTGYIRGGCTAIGMKKDYPCFLDASAQQYEEIFISGGRLGSEIILTPAVFLEATGGTMLSLTMAE